MGLEYGKHYGCKDEVGKFAELVGWEKNVFVEWVPELARTCTILDHSRSMLGAYGIFWLQFKLQYGNRVMSKHLQLFNLKMIYYEMI